jgi:hypothetical protein
MDANLEPIIILHTTFFGRYFENTRTCLNKFTESDNSFEMNNNVQDISVAGVGSIHDTTSQQVLSS